MLQYVKNKDINKRKWDNLIKDSKNGFIYSLSSYLDIVSNNWDALIYKDYEIVMPLPYKKKYGIKYIMQPLFSQQLGIIYKVNPAQNILNEFYRFLKNSFLYFNINLNFDNKPVSFIKNTNKTNLILNLNSNYEVLYSNFSKNTKRNIKKAKKENLTVNIEKQNCNNFINFFISNIKTKEPEQTFTILKNIINFSFNNNIGEIISIKENEELLTSVFILKSFNRYIYLAATSNNKGKDKKAMFYLLDNFINNKSNTNYLLDFEGSGIEGVSRFYKGFNAVNQNYSTIFKYFF